MPEVRLEFGGGMELLFGGQRELRVTLPDDCQTMAQLLAHVRDELCAPASRSLFMAGDTIRPGVLVLINDADWELEGEGAYRLRPDDRIVFISTLHGG